MSARRSSFAAAITTPSGTASLAASRTLDDMPSVSSHDDLEKNQADLAKPVAPSRNGRSFGGSTLAPSDDNNNNNTLGLPLPATTKAPSTRSKAKSTTQNQQQQQQQLQKRTRVGGLQLKVRWARVRRRLGTGTAPSSSSAINDSTTGGHSSFQHGFRRRTRDDTEKADGEGADGEGDEDGTDQLDEVVVDREWSDEIKSSVAHSEHGGTPEKSGSHHMPGTSVDRESFATHIENVWLRPFIILRWRVWPMLVEFFQTRFYDEKAENHYRKETWFSGKVWLAFFIFCSMTNRDRCSLLDTCLLFHSIHRHQLDPLHHIYPTPTIQL
jgi:hypothetical protein